MVNIQTNLPRLFKRLCQTATFGCKSFNHNMKWQSSCREWRRALFVGGGGGGALTRDTCTSTQNYVICGRFWLFGGGGAGRWHICDPIKKCSTIGRWIICSNVLMTTIFVWYHPVCSNRAKTVLWWSLVFLVCLLGDSTAWVLPFTSGGFIYIALITILPDLLQETRPRYFKYWSFLLQQGCT